MIDKLRLGGFADEASDSIEGQCRVLKALCWSNIELRAVNGKQIADLSEDEFQHVLETLNEKWDFSNVSWLKYRKLGAVYSFPS